MKTKPETDPLVPATDELSALALAARPDWREHELHQALLACRTAGWTWRHTLTVTVRLLADPHGTPWELKRLTASPVTRMPGAQPGEGYRRAREALASRG